EYFPGFLQKRLATIPNPVIPPPFLGEAPELPPRTVLAVGRIAPQKGYDVLLDAFAQVSATHPQWRLCIAGGGGPTDSLKSQAKSLGIDDNVRFLGAVRDVGGLLRQAEIYVMSSRYEGFPNALCEAMASGLPCVSSDCPSGPAEIIEHEVNGLLVPNANAEALASALRRLMDDPGLRKRLAAKAAELTASFSENRIMDLWEDLLRRILGRKSAQVGQDKAL
ncbi:MAG: glycosyltransferase, partial [Desulfovibrionaceae bacterium]